MPTVEPKLRTDQSLKVVLSSLLETLEANESGIRADQDAECLHDFRVAVRRSRALVSQLNDVFEPHVVTWFAREYRWLGHITGPVRDLDVFLERLLREQVALPAAVRASVTRLTAKVEAERQGARAPMLVALDSTRYRTLKRSAREFLLLPVPERRSPKDAHRPVDEVVATCLRRAYQRARAEGRKVCSSTPVALLHELRIRCKHLRYLLDTFGRLFDAAETRPVGKALRRLQDRLGRIHDCDVQGRSLDAWRERLQHAGAADGELLLAIGSLDERSRQRQKKARKRLRRQLEKFCGPETRKRMRRIVKGR